MLRMGLAAVYVVFGLLAAVSMLGNDPESSAPAAGALATFTLPIVVATGEAVATSMLYLSSFEALARAPAEMKGSLLIGATDMINSGAWMSWLAFACASLVALIGALGASHPDQRPALIYPGLAGIVVGALFLSNNASPSFLMLQGMFR